MPVTTRPSGVKPETVIGYNVKGGKIGANDLLRGCCTSQRRARQEDLIASSFGLNREGEESTVSTYRNGFVSAAIRAYSKHHHLVIRPDEVWFTILLQLNAFINANAEELRYIFVDHEGQVPLVIEGWGTLRSYNWDVFALQMANMVKHNIKVPSFKTWMTPKFSTTQHHDTVIASICVMATMQKYFSYVSCLGCGLPSVTLLGEKEDWEILLRRMGTFPFEHKEIARWTRVLKPVLSRFVQTFDNPESHEIKDFWSRIAHVHSGSGSTHYSGWITAFCFWDNDGNSVRPADYYDSTDASVNIQGLMLDDVVYHRVDANQVPSGIATVPVLVIDNGEEHETIMAAGLVGYRVMPQLESLAAETSDNSLPEESISNPVAIDGSDTTVVSNGLVSNIPQNAEITMNTLQPVSGWWMVDVTKKA